MSISFKSPILVPARRCWQWADSDIDSWPPAMMILASPEAICCMPMRDGAQAGAADLVQAPGGGFLRHAGVDGGLARRVLALAGRQHLAEDHLVDFTGLDASARQHFLDHDAAEVMRWGGGEGAVE